MTDIRELLAKNIKKYRKLRGFSQENLAERAKTSLTHIGMIETAKKFPSVNMLEQIADALGIDTPELFASGKVVFLPYQDKSVERLYHEIMGEFDDFKARVAGKLRQS